LIAAREKDWGFLETGNTGMVMSFLSGTSEAAELESALTPVRANTVLNTMAAMRAQSSSGASGLGAMSEPERIMLRDSAGALDARVPAQLVSTLLNMRKSLPQVLQVQEDSFKTGFGPILGIEPEIPDPNASNVPDKPLSDPDAMAAGSGESGVKRIRLDHYEKGGSGG